MVHVRVNSVVTDVDVSIITGRLSQLHTCSAATRQLGVCMRHKLVRTTMLMAQGLILGCTSPLSSISVVINISFLLLLLLLLQIGCRALSDVYLFALIANDFPITQPDPSDTAKLICGFDVKNCLHLGRINYERVTNVVLKCKAVVSGSTSEQRISRNYCYHQQMRCEPYDVLVSRICLYLIYDNFRKL